MAFQIRERGAFGLVPPAAMHEFLKVQGWKPSGPNTVGPATVYTKAIDGRLWDLEVPNDPAASDYADMVIIAGSVVAVAEQLAPFKIFTQLMRLVSYTIAMIPVNADRPTSLIEKYGASIQRELRSLLAAAAMASESSQPMYRGIPSQQTQLLLSSAVQPVEDPERGQSILHVPIVSDAGSPNDAPAAEFALTAMDQLLQALNAAAGLSEPFRRTEPLERLYPVVQKGVSANFCDALARLVAMCGEVSIAVTLAEAGTDTRPEHSFTYDAETGALLTRLAHSLRRHMPRFSVPVSGQVVRLARAPGTLRGTATLQLDKGQFAARVTVVLSGELFSAAIQSFAEQRVLRITGEVLRDGSTFALHNPRDIVLTD